MNRHSDAATPVRSSGAVSTWFGRHVTTASASFGKLVRQPFASLMIVMVIAVTLALPAALNLMVKQKRKYKATTDSKHQLPVAENVLNRQFNPTGPNQVWGTDIT